MSQQYYIELAKCARAWNAKCRTKPRATFLSYLDSKCKPGPCHVMPCMLGPMSCILLDVHGYLLTIFSVL